MADQVEKMTAKGTTNRAMSRDVAEEYASSLADLTVNSKPLINMLTMLAEDYIDHAPIIVKAVEAHLQKILVTQKLDTQSLCMHYNVGGSFCPVEY